MTNILHIVTFDLSGDEVATVHPVTHVASTLVGAAFARSFNQTVVFKYLHTDNTCTHIYAKKKKKKS